MKNCTLHNTVQITFILSINAKLSTGKNMILVLHVVRKCKSGRLYDITFGLVYELYNKQKYIYILPISDACFIVSNPWHETQTQNPISSSESIYERNIVTLFVKLSNL